MNSGYLGASVSFLPFLAALRPRGRGIRSGRRAWRGARTTRPQARADPRACRHAGDDVDRATHRRISAL